MAIFNRETGGFIRDEELVSSADILYNMQGYSPPNISPKSKPIAKRTNSIKGSSKKNIHKEIHKPLEKSKDTP